jgi:hypothetical protein
VAGLADGPAADARRVDHDWTVAGHPTVRNAWVAHESDTEHRGNRNCPGDRALCPLFLRHAVRADLATGGAS